MLTVLRKQGFKVSKLIEIILKPSSNRSPNSFTLVQKVKIGHTKKFNSNDKSRLCRYFAGYFISK